MKNGSARLPAFVAAIAIVAGLSGCQYLSLDSCVYELRTIEAAGQLSENSTNVLYAKLGVSEQRDAGPNKSMYWILLGPNLKGHLTSAFLRDIGDPSKTLFTFPISPASQADLAQGFVDELNGADLNGFFGLLADGKAVVEVHTDIPGRETLSIVPSIVYKQDWNRPSCG